MLQATASSHPGAYACALSAVVFRYYPVLSPSIQPASQPEPAGRLYPTTADALLNHILKSSESILPSPDERWKLKLKNVHTIHQCSELRARQHKQPGTRTLVLTPTSTHGPKITLEHSEQGLSPWNTFPPAQTPTVCAATMLSRSELRHHRSAIKSNLERIEY